MLGRKEQNDKGNQNQKGTIPAWDLKEYIHTHTMNGHRRPLFDAPFTQMASATPLRARHVVSENDSFADIPFEKYQRRKPNQDQWIVRTAMKAVLLSPVFVLVVWSFAAIVFTHNHQQQQQQTRTMMSNPIRTSSRRQQKKQQQQNSKRNWWSRNRDVYPQQMMFPVQGNAAGMIVQPQYLPAQLMPGQYPLLQQQQQPPMPQQNMIMMMTPQQQQQMTLPYSAIQPNVPILSQQQRQYSAQAVVPYNNIPQDLTQQQPLAAQGNIGATQAPLPVQIGGMDKYNGFIGEDQVAQQLLMQGNDVIKNYKIPEETFQALPPPLNEDVSPEIPFAETHQALQRSQPQHTFIQHLRHPPIDAKVQYYYYDPRATIQDELGNILVLPQTVYDSYGRPVPLQSLQAAKEIQIESPHSMIHHNISANATVLNITYSHPNTVNTPVKDRKKSISYPVEIMSSVGGWGETTASDSSIIVATVGVMALLVGALSARRMRARSILAMCIENESLEEDAAYDTAYTTTGNSNNNQYYNTFQQGWKGDLEKFDV